MSKSTLRPVLVVAVVFAAIAAPTLAGVAVADSHNDGPPPVPAAYYGTATVNGEPIVTGTDISAVVDGEVRDTITVDTAGEFGGSDAFADKLVVENVSDGATVSFEVRGTAAAETVAWESGAVETLELTFTDVSPPEDDGNGDDNDDNDDDNGGNGGSGGGGGGGSSIAAGADYSTSISDARPAKVGVTVTFSQTALNAITLSNEDAEGTVGITERDSVPSDAPSLGTDRPVVTAFEITVPDDQTNEPATLEMEFSTDDLEDAGLTADELVVLRAVDDEYETLDTSAEVDGDVVTVTAETPGFSTFVVTEAQDEETPDEPTDGTPDDGSTTDTPDEQGGPGIPLIGGLVIVLLAIAGALYMVYGRD